MPTFPKGEPVHWSRPISSSHRRTVPPLPGLAIQSPRAPVLRTASNPQRLDELSGARRGSCRHRSILASAGTPPGLSGPLHVSVPRCDAAPSIQYRTKHPLSVGRKTSAIFPAVLHAHTAYRKSACLAQTTVRSGGLSSRRQLTARNIDSFVTPGQFKFAERCVEVQSARHNDRLEGNQIWSAAYRPFFVLRQF